MSSTAITNRFQEQFGTPSGRAAIKVRDYMTPFVQEFIQHAPFVVMATSDKDGNCDTSPKGGKPGFVRILDDRHLLLPDVAGNKLFQSYANMDGNPHVGLLFLIPGIDETVRVNGSVHIVSQEELQQRQIAMALHNPDDKAKHLQGIVIEVDEAYAHCPRALKFSKLWDTAQIHTHQTQRPISDRPYDS